MSFTLVQKKFDLVNCRSFFVLTLRFSRISAHGDLEFGREVTKVW